MKIKKAIRIVELACAFSIFATTGFAAETTLLRDEFRNASANPKSIAIDSIATWYAFYSRGGQLPTPKEVKDAGTFSHGLEFSGQSQNVLLVASFPAVHLKRAGDCIKLAVTYRYLHGPTNPARGFVTGLYNSNGMPLTIGNGDTLFRKEPEVGTEHVGYRVGKNPNSDAQDLILDKAVGASSAFPSKALSTSDSGMLVQAKKPHVLELRITRQADDSYSVEYGIDGKDFKATDVDASAAGAQFDTVVLHPLGRDFGKSSGNSYVNVLDVSVVSQVD